MIGLRHEEYGNLSNEFPFSLGINLERTPFNCSKEQNWHDNLEIQLCTDGNGIVLLDGEKYDITKGDVIVVNSNVVHYTFTDSFLKYTCLIISTKWCKQMNIDYASLFFSPRPEGVRLFHFINKLVYTYSDYTDKLRIAKLNDILLHILIELAEHHSSPRLITTSRGKKFDSIKAAITFIQNNYNKHLSLSEISKGVLLDKYTLCKEFKRYTGQTVIGYLHQYRSIKAIDFLSDGYTVAETAALCGFENMSFFTRIFKRYTGNNPSFYKK